MFYDSMLGHFPNTYHSTFCANPVGLKYISSMCNIMHSFFPPHCHVEHTGFLLFCPYFGFKMRKIWPIYIRFKFSLEEI